LELFAPAQEKFIVFIDAGLGLPSLWSERRNPVFLGSEAFVAHMHTGISPEQSPDGIPLHNAVRQPDHWPVIGRGMTTIRGLGWRWLISRDYATKAIVNEFGVHYTTVSRAVKEYESKKHRCDFARLEHPAYIFK
jgi:putative transposase